MNGILLRTLIAILGLYIASAVLPGVQISGAGTFVFAAILLGLVNGFVRPIAFLLTLPITIVTLGLFLFVLNRIKTRPELRKSDSSFLGHEKN